MNRGRIQAQGKKVEKSDSWATKNDHTKKIGLNGLDKVKKQLTKKELKDRKQPIIDCKKDIMRFPSCGITPTKKSYNDFKTKTRIDIEVNKGIAFKDEQKKHKENKKKRNKKEK